MAFPTAVNDQITDDAQARPTNNAGPLATGNLLLSASHASGIAMENAVYNQQELNVLAAAATTQCVQVMLEAASAQPAPSAGTAITTSTASAGSGKAADTTAPINPGPVVDATLAATLKQFGIGLAMLDAVSQQHHLDILLNAAAVASFRAQLADDPVAAFERFEDYCDRHSAAQQLSALIAVEDAFPDAPDTDPS